LSTGILRTRLLLITAACGLVTSSFVAGAPGALAASTATKAQKAASTNGYAAGRYIVTFADEPAATYEGNVSGYPRTRPDRGKKLDPTRPAVVNWRSHLTSVHNSALAAVGATKISDYTVATNGVAAELTAAQANRLARTAGVVRLERARIQHVDSDESTAAYLGLKDPNGLWSQFAGGGAGAGKGVVIGEIDTGIWPEDPSFAGGELKRDAAGLPVPASGLRGQWFGPCVQGENFSSQDCNDKVIGARYYTAGFGQKDIAKKDYLSPRDGDGHGSHTASTAAGEIEQNVTVEGRNFGTVSGMAPGADIAAYKVCWDGAAGIADGCSSIDIVSAIDDAVADGVDVINMSIGATVETSIFDSEAQAFRRAANVGIFIANSAGNSGPGASTLDHPAPWVTTVAASTYRFSEAVLQLGNGTRIVGASLTPGLPQQTPLVTASSVKLAGAADADAARCFAGTLDPTEAAGKVVLCDRGVNDRTAKGEEVKRAGGAAMVLGNVTVDDVDADIHVLPAIHIHTADHTRVLSYMSSTSSPTAAIVPVNTGESATKIPEVADFSSRGPSTTLAGDILKPDLAAPGVDVLAAVAPPFHFGRSYDFLSGTSMASPHIAGLGALLKAVHPTWSPAEVRSALMTTGRDHASSKDPFAQGSGLVQPNKALDPGLVFDESANDWRSFMVGQGALFAAPFDTLPSMDASDLNQSSIAIGSLTGNQTVTRTVTSVATASESYTMSANVPGVSVVAPSSVFTIAPGATKTLPIRITRTSAPFHQWAKGNLTLTGNKGHVIRIPVVVQPVPVSAPAEVTGTGASGSTAYDVTAGFTGTLTTKVVGLLGATPTPGTVTTGPFDLDNPVESAATKKFPLHIDPGTKLARFDLDATSNSDDLDLYVFKDGKFLTFSATEAADERVTLVDPAAGDYTAYVNGFNTTNGGGFSYTQWAVPVGDVGNAHASNNVSVAIATVAHLTVSWSGLDPAKRYLGYVEYQGGPDRTIVAIG